MSKRIEDLDPRLQSPARAIEDAGYKITHTLRTMEEQAHLFAKGRTIPGPKVTNARPGQSPHNYGLAFDICGSGKQPYPNPDTPAGKQWWKTAGDLGKSLGLAWGGDWKRFKDYPHFELPNWKAEVGK